MTRGPFEFLLQVVHIKALKNLEREDILKFFDVKLFDTYCLRKFPQFTDIIKQHARDYGFSISKNDEIKLISNRSAFERIIRKLRHHFKSTVKIYDLKDISEAARWVAGRMKI